MPDRSASAHVAGTAGTAVRRSPISGHGLFARQDIPAGTAVFRLGGRLVNADQFKDLLDRSRTRGYLDTITVTDPLHLVLPPGRPTARATTSAIPTCGGPDRTR